MNAYLAAQRERDKQVELVLFKILDEISSLYSREGEDASRQNPSLRENVYEIIEGSALVPFIEVCHVMICSNGDDMMC